MNDEKIARINELARKKKAEGLTAAEADEQAELRREYIAEFRRSLRGQLESIDLKNPDGSVTSVKARHDEKYGTCEYQKD